MSGLTRQSPFRHIFVFSLLFLSISLFIFAYARPVASHSVVNSPVWQENTAWCFSQIEDREREVGYFLAHTEGMTAVEILDAYNMPESWKDTLEFLVCYEDWQEALQLMTDTMLFPRIRARDSAEFKEILRQRAGLPWIVWLRTLEAPSTDSTLQIDETWCYSFFQEGTTDQGVFLGHFPGLTPEDVLEDHASTLDLTKDWTERGSHCVATWQLARSFAYYLTEDQVPLYGQSEMYFAWSVTEIYGTPWPAHRLLAPFRASALLDPNAQPVWCHLVFTGGAGSTVTFSHYPDRTTEDVLEFYNPPDWIRELAAQETTNCYTSWEAAFRARPFEWKKAMLHSLPDNPSEADYEAIMLKSAFGHEWQDYQRAEFSAEGTPDPIMLTRIAPTPTITPTPTATPTKDARAVSRDSAVWCFTHVEDLSHEVIFYMGHPPEMDYNGIRQAYKLPPGLLTRPDRETYCYENWHEAAIFVRSFSPGDIITYVLPEDPSADQIREYQTLIEQSFGTLHGDNFRRGNPREPGYRNRPDQPVWCYSYFNKSGSSDGIYLGHYVTEGNEAILADYAENLSGGWNPVENTTQCFEEWYDAASFYERSLGQYLKNTKFNMRPYDYALALITKRAPIPFSGQPIPVATPTATVTPTATPTPTRPPSRVLLDPDITDPVWCYTIFTGGNGSTASFGHYPDMSTEEVFDMFNAPDWVKNLAAQEKTDCYAGWEAAFEGMWPPGLKVGMSSYLPDNPSEADYEMVILWTYFKIQWQDYQRTEFSAGGTPQPIILTRVAPDIGPTPTPPSDKPIWCFTLYYDHTPGVFDVMVGHYPDMDADAIATMHQLDETFQNRRPERKTACFYSYTDAAKFQRAIFEGARLATMRLSEDEAVNQKGIEARYIKQAYEMVFHDDLERAKQIFDDGLFTQPRNQNAALPESDPNALLLDTDNPPVWCRTSFRQKNDQLIGFGHYPDLDVEEVKALYFVTDLLADALVEKRLCYSSWEDAAKYYRFPATSQLNEADFEILVLQSSFTGLWSTYQRPEFSPSVTPQIFQASTPTATPTPDRLTAAALLNDSNLPRWCRTMFIHMGGQEMTVGHYPDMDIESFLHAIKAERILSTDCYSSWQAAVETLPEKEYARLTISQTSTGEITEQNYELALLYYHFGQWMEVFQRPEFSAGVTPDEVTPVSFDDVVRCNYFLVKENSYGTGALVITHDNYPDMTIEEVLSASVLHKDWVADQPVLRTIFCYDSWQKLMEYGYGQDADAFSPDLPDQLNDGDYEVMYLWFTHQGKWKDYQRPEFSAKEAPQQAVIDFVEDMIERLNQ